MITFVRFSRPQNIGGVEVDHWSSLAPHSTALAGKISPRPGKAELGEQPDSIIFECRISPSDPYDVEVRANAIDCIIRKPEAKTKAKP